MYAIVKAGGHQYKVRQGDQITVDFQAGNVGDKVKLDQVLMVGGTKINLGAPLVQGASVEAVVKAQSHNDKVLIFKYKRRKNYKRTRGHKQPVTVLEISKING